MNNELKNGLGKRTGVTEIELAGTNLIGEHRPQTKVRYNLYWRKYNENNS